MNSFTRSWLRREKSTIDYRRGLHRQPGPRRLGVCHTTNNRMELMAAIKGLEMLKEKCEVEITTDSQYVMKGITEWIHGWKKKGWVTASKAPVVNKDLWLELEFETQRHKTNWSWTKGHASHADNNRCDELATTAARNQTASE